MKARRVLLLSLVVAGAFVLPASPQAGAAEKEGFDYSDYAALLKEYVDERGMVDYRGLRGNRRRLNAFVRALGSTGRSEYQEWSEEAKIAFWLNAYNGITLKIIVEHYPIEPNWPASIIYPDDSIRQIDGVWDEIEHPVLGKPMTLDEIEHQTLRAEFSEPRIHVALVCAAMGCPPLRNEPYLAQRLEAQFDDQARAFLSNPAKFRIDRARGEVHVSSIFKWFGEDFVPEYGTDSRFAGHGQEERAVLNWIVRYLDDADRRYLLKRDYDIEYLDYDWSLNEQD